VYVTWYSSCKLLNTAVQCMWHDIVLANSWWICTYPFFVIVIGSFIFSYMYVMFLYYALQPSRLIVRSELDVPTFATRHHHARAPSGGRWNCGREVSGNFCLNADFHATFRDLLHVVKLWHGTDGFTSPPKEGVLRIFSP